MRKLILLALASFVSVAYGGWFTSNTPDTKTRDEVRFTRKGALGNNDYVVSDVYPPLPSYALVTEPTTQLVDRAVNLITLERDTTFVMPPEPVKRTVDSYRAARSFILRVAITNQTPPKVWFDGCEKLVSTSGENSIDLTRGENLLSFIEIGTGTFMVEMRDLTQISNER